MLCVVVRMLRRYNVNEAGLSSLTLEFLGSVLLIFFRKVYSVRSHPIEGLCCCRSIVKKFGDFVSAKTINFSILIHS